MNSVQAIIDADFEKIEEMTMEVMYGRQPRFMEQQLAEAARVWIQAIFQWP